MERENLIWTQEGFLNEVTCLGPYSLKEFLSHLNEKLADVNSHMDRLSTKDISLARSRLHLYLEKPDDLGEDEARVKFVTEFPNSNAPNFLKFQHGNLGFYNSSFRVEIFNRDFKRVSVSFHYGFRRSTGRGGDNYSDSVSIDADEDFSPLVSLMLQIIYESMMYAQVLQRYKTGLGFGPISLHVAQHTYNFLNPLMEEGFRNAVRWINARLTPDQEAKRRQSYIDYLVEIQWPGQAWEHSSRYERHFHL